MKETEFAYACAYTRTLENKMLAKSDFEALLSASSFSEAVSYLQGIGYGGGAENADDYETMLKQELCHIWNEVTDACPEGTPLNILLYQNDFHNLKAILKSILSGVEYQPLMLAPCVISPEVIHRAVSDGKLDSLPEAIASPTEEAYKVLTRDSDGQLAEIVLDKALFSVTRAIARKSRNEFLVGFVDLNIALMNMKVALRGIQSGKDRRFMRNAMLSCERMDADVLADMAAAGDVSDMLKKFGFSQKEYAISAFEKWCDNELIRYVKTMRYKTLGFEPIFAFLVGKQFELQTLRIILSGQRSGISREVLRERLRDFYV